MGPNKIDFSATTITPLQNMVGSGAIASVGMKTPEIAVEVPKPTAPVPAPGGLS